VVDTAAPGGSRLRRWVWRPPASFRRIAAALRDAGSQTRGMFFTAGASMTPLSASTRNALQRVAAVSILACVALLVLIAAPARSADPAPFAAAFADFQRAAAGDPGAIDAAAGRFDALSAAAPGDPVLLAYSGAALALRARTTLLPWKKMSYAEDGLARIDKALTLLTPAHDAALHRGTSASLETRFTAASCFLALPGLFNRHARGTRLLGDVLASPLFAAAPLPFRGAVWLRAGIEAAADQRPDDARRWWQQVVDSDAPQAGSARARLMELGS
jgi:hypothetical protein